MSKLRGETAVVGIGLAGLGQASGWSAIEIMAESAKAALADAGLGLKDVDGLFVSSSTHAMPTITAAEYLGIRPRHFSGTMAGGASFEVHVLTAATALRAGLCDVALIAYGSNQRSAAGRLVSSAEPQVNEAVYDPRQPITAYALATARHMHEFGTTRTHLAEVAVAARAWAGLNPRAFKRDPLTLDDVLAAPMVSDPLSRLDCCLVTDGGGAVVMMRADAARDRPKAPVYLLGAGCAHWHRQIAMMQDLTVTAATQSGAAAYAMAGLGPHQMDMVQLYDAFTINTLLFLEDLGFCRKGEGGSFVSGGAIAPGGRLAVNTNGGGLSCVHPGMYGIFPIIEAVEQLRGEAGARQQVRADTAMVHGNGGTLSCQASCIFGTEATLTA
ncbi:acetyl-CoA acetyltransferase [Pinisolibacter aquiterrae]|uniref:acetyl-CoA acetyltransferase n=1 Tax=Pinisolibacter aquiterrae TaxID=2815579 RepID=UPI001C3D4A5B|nr:acetyl-CoA acetyltransferase [Pinisolibacter aquiterrae]MBV5266886.1 thiolase [Pinisolibacter aquiterrae]MCC8234803.1 thiolase [Pinisolibacter aquiterrae]